MASTGRRKFTLAAVVATLSLFSVPVLTAGPAAAAPVVRIPLTAGRTLSGVVGGGGETTADAFAAYRGRANEVVTSYISTNSWDAITGVSKQGLTSLYSGTNAHLVWSVPLLPLNGSATLAQAATGMFNSKYASVAQQLVAGGDGSATIRLGWELNGDWYSWGGTKDPASFVGAWRQAVTAMRGVPGQHFTFDWNITLGYANPLALYPGDDVVDLIGADVYDASYSSFSPTDHLSSWHYMLTRPWGLNWLATYAAQHGKRISIPEWGVQWLCNGHGGGDDPYFVQQMYAWIASHDVAYEAYFNHDLDSCNNSALNDGRFPQSAVAYKQLFSAATTPPGTTPPVVAPPAPVPASAFDLERIKVSKTAARTSPVMLFASTVSGPAYIFVSDAPGTVKVTFYLDKATTTAPTATDTAAPWDLKGGTATAAIGLAPTNSVAQDLKADGFKEAATVHSELFRLKNGRTRWDSHTLVVVDEAAMLDSRVTGELLAEAKRSGAKLVLAGDDRQLASIERGGLFTELRQRHGSAEITEVTRQRSDWQRGAAHDMAEGRVAAAVEAFAAHGAITWTKRQDEARAALVERWRADTAERPDASRFVFAYTNRDVDRLNTELRAVRRERGKLGNDVRLDTKHGPADFAVGDRVQFTDTLKAAKIYNGNAGTVTGIDAETGTVRARLDGADGQGREVVWSASEFAGFRHGYAGTIYKGQGKTLDHTYLLHSHHWRQASSYVALTRQRETAQIFVATESARDTRELAWQMGRVEVRSASVAWATADEVSTTQATTLRQRARDAQGTGDAEPGEVQGQPATVQAGGRPETRPSPATDRVIAVAPPPKPDEVRQDWLIPPRVSPDVRDSLGRGLDPGSIAAAVAGNRAVQHEREALHGYLKGSFRDPYEAHARLSELMKSDGAVSTARRLAADPGQLGELRGKTGWLAGREGREERARAERVAEAVGPAVSRIGEAETRAAQGYRGSVEARLAAEATGVPSLSERAQEALAAVAKVEDDRAKAKAWTAVQKDEAVALEIAGFRAAAAKRFGEEGVRAMLRTEWRGGSPYESDASVPKDYKAAVAEAARLIAAAMSGEIAASASQRQSERLVQRESQGPRLRS